MTRELLDRLESLGVDLRVDNGRLRVSAPRGLLSDELRQAVATHKESLMRLLEARRSAPPEALVPVERAHGLPLSLFQERLWLLDRLEPGGTAYNMATLWRREGPVDIDRHLAAIRSVVARHEILHATFVDGDGGPMARLRAPEDVRIELQDLRNLTDEEQGRTVFAARDRATTTPFDLAADAPAHFTVYRVVGNAVVTLAALHHIAVDAWSVNLLIEEIEAAYDGTLPEPPRLQYADFAAWQRSALTGDKGRAALQWWMQRLAGAPALSTFPSGVIAPPASGERPAHTFDFRLDAALAERVRRMARAGGATVYMAFVAAVAVALRRHTGQTDMVLGSPMGVRDRPEFERMIGPFVNLLLMRIDLSGDPSFAQVLERTRDMVLDAYEHRDVAFESLLEQLKPARSLRHSPLFQVAVVQHNAPSRPGFEIPGGGAMHELTFFLREADDGLEVSAEYRADLHGASAIRRICGHVESILAAAADKPDAPVRLLPLLGAAERRLLIERFNATALEQDPDLTVARFERQAASRPEDVAVVFDGAALTYGELNRRANRFARHLGCRGLGRDATVAVCLERGLPLVVALLGTMKAGAAYLPLDPGFPAERLAFMLDDSEAGALVTTADIADGLTLPADLPVIDPEAADRDGTPEDATDPPAVSEPQDAAYLIYTSGSTGRPKGVVVPHGALANFLASMQREPGLTAGDVLAAVTTVSFDIAGLELFLPLVTGARIELIARDVAVDGVALAERLRSCGATVLQATPATWRLLLETDWHGGPRFKALCGGEAMTRELADLLLARVGELWNLYGPTETTIWSTTARIAADAAPITVGRPIANTRVYVVDPEGMPQPVGVAGEILIGGAGLALGYHRRPDLTAEKFVPDRLSRSPGVGARLYRTGDLGRWDEDGRLHHLGRIDHQVKVRGFRIELGEVESVLSSNPAIRQAVCAAPQAGPGDHRLVAYVAFHAGEDLTVSEVRRFLRRQLPDYMVPSLVIAVDGFALMPNGKVDRAALPDPFRNATQAASRAPLAPGLEELLGGIWRDILKVEEVGADDNFFELGGHSLLALRVAVAFQQRTGTRIDPRALFFQSLRQVALMAQKLGATAAATGTTGAA